MLEIEKQNLFKKIITKVEKMNSRCQKNNSEKIVTLQDYKNQRTDENLYRLLTSFCHLNKDYLLAINILRKKYCSEIKFIEKCVSCRISKAGKTVRFILNSIASELEAIYHKDYWVHNITGPIDGENKQENLVPKKRVFKENGTYGKSNVDVETCESTPLFGIFDFDEFEDSQNLEIVKEKSDNEKKKERSSEELINLDFHVKFPVMQNIEGEIKPVKFTNRKKPANPLIKAPNFKDQKKKEEQVFEKQNSNFSHKEKNPTRKSESFVVVSHKISLNSTLLKFENMTEKNRLFENNNHNSDIIKLTPVSEIKEGAKEYLSSDLDVFKNIIFLTSAQNEESTDKNANSSDHTPINNGHFLKKNSKKSCKDMLDPEPQIQSFKSQFPKTTVCQFKESALKIASKGANYSNKSSNISEETHFKQNLPGNKSYLQKNTNNPLSFSTVTSLKTNKRSKQKETEKDKFATISDLSKWESDEEVFRNETIKEIVDLIQEKTESVIYKQEVEQKIKTTKDPNLDLINSNSNRNKGRNNGLKNRYKFKSWEPKPQWTLNVQKTVLDNFLKAKQETQKTKCYTKLLNLPKIKNYSEFKKAHFNLLKNEPNIFPQKADSSTENEAYYLGISYEIQLVTNSLIDFSETINKSRNLVKERLNTILQDRLDSKIVYLQEFGSFPTKLLTPFSDLDLAIRNTHSENREHVLFILNFLQIELMNLNFVLKQTPITTATIPVVKIEADPSIEFRDFEKADLCFTIKADIIVEQTESFEINSTPFRTTEFVEWCVEHTCTFYEIVLLLKFALASNGLANSYTGNLKRRFKCLFPLFVVFRLLAKSGK